MRQQETLNLLKSALIFRNGHRLRFIVMTEDSLMAGFREKLDDWSSIIKDQFTFQVLPLIFPKENGAEWRNLFKPCASQRLFLPVSCLFFHFACGFVYSQLSISIFLKNCLGYSHRCRLGAIYGHRYSVHGTCQ